MSDPFVAEVRIFAGNFAPRGWAFCEGQLISISQNTALFSLLGTTYGGNGQTNFGLPNLRGRAPMHPGNGPGLSPHSLGEMGGSSTVTLTSSQIPAHTHTMKHNKTVAGDSNSPAGKLFAKSVVPVASVFSSSPPDMAIASSTVAGGSQPHNNMQPYLGVSYIIALQGIYPPRT
ncbi:MAG: tail fiber protein [Bacteroidota bacterium]|nr:tail fiber protein [Bacteroidota bacterium]